MGNGMWLDNGMTTNEQTKTITKTWKDGTTSTFTVYWCRSLQRWVTIPE